MIEYGIAVGGPAAASSNRIDFGSWATSIVNGPTIFLIAGAAFVLFFVFFILR